MARCRLAAEGLLRAVLGGRWAAQLITDPLEGAEEGQCQKSSLSLALECEQAPMLAAKKVCDPRCSSVANGEPDDFRRSSSEEAALAEVVVLRNHGEAVVPCA